MEQKQFETTSGTITYWISYASENETPGYQSDDQHTEENSDNDQYKSQGSQVPWLVFLPGLTADHRLFNRQISYFMPRTNCLVWDPPAHGKSRPFELSFSLDDLAGMLHDLLQNEGIDHPILIGQSMGGYVSQAFIALFPGVAKGFVSIDSAPLERAYYRSWEITALKHTKRMYECIPWGLLKYWGAKGCATSFYGQSLMKTMMNSYSKKEYCALAAHGYKILAEAIEKTALPSNEKTNDYANDRTHDHTDDHTDDYADEHTSDHATVTNAKASEKLDEPNHPTFRKPNCPTLLIWGEKDQAAFAKKYNQRWALETGLSFIEIPGAGHNSNTDAPDLINKHIDIFIEEVTRK